MIRVLIGLRYVFDKTNLPIAEDDPFLNFPLRPSPYGRIPVFRRKISINSTEKLTVLIEGKGNHC